MATTINSLFDALRGFSEEDKRLAWSKAFAVPGRDPRVIRKDNCGAWIKWTEYGNTDNEWGWEIDHIYPVARGGTNIHTNLQALHWKNNRAKGDSITGFKPAVIAV